MHFLLPLSGFNRIVNCWGSVMLEAQYPDETIEEAEEGTAAHWLAEKMLTHETFMYRDECVGLVAPNGVVIDETIYDGAAMYRTAIHKATSSLPILSHLVVEKLLPAARIHPLAGGTVDAAAYFKDRNELWIWDFKFGHVIVDAEENYQAIGYYAALADFYGIDGHVDQFTTVHIVIVQPRAYHREGCVRTWTVKGSDLRPYINMMADAAHRAVEANASTSAGEHCLHCKAANDCEALQRATFKAISYSGKSERAEMPLDEAARELDTLRHAEQLIVARRKAREANLEQAIANGEHVQGYALERYKSGRRKFTVDNDQLIALGTMCKVNLFKQVPLTPNQAENEGVPAYLLNDITESVTGSPKLVKVEQTTAYKAFNKRD